MVATMETENKREVRGGSGTLTETQGEPHPKPQYLARRRRTVRYLLTKPSITALLL